MRTACVLTLAATTLVCAVAAGAAAATSARKCNPTYKFCDLGVLPAGVYTTRYFLHGMRVRVPGSGWISHQDSTTEFKLSPPGYPNPNTIPVLRFWIDPRVSTPCTDKVLPIRLRTPAQAVRWMTKNKNFTVSATKRTTIGGHLAAVRLDYDVSRRAPECSPSCGGPCIDYFMFMGGPQPDATDLAPTHTPGIKDGFGTGINDPVRLYFAHIGTPSHSHLFMVGIETPKGHELTRLRTEAAKMLAHLRLPTKLPRTGRR